MIFLITLLTLVWIILPEDNKLWKFSNLSQGEAAPRAGVCWEKGVRVAML